MGKFSLFVIRIALVLYISVLNPVVFVKAAQSPLYFGFVVTDDLTAKEIVPAMEVALTLINNNSYVLPDHHLSYVTWQSNCDRTVSINGFLDHVLEKCNSTQDGEITFLGVIGCGCTQATLPIAEIIHRWNIPLISYSPGSAELHNQIRFPSYFQTYPSGTNLGKGLLAVLSEFGWRRLAVFSDNSPRFVEAFAMISAVINSTNTSLELEHVLLDGGNSSRNISSLDLIKDEFRIFFLNTYEETARDILCLARQRSLLFPRYAWIIYGWYTNDWLISTYDEALSQCSNEELLEFLSAARVIALQQYPTSENMDIVGGITSSEFHNMYRALQENGVPYVPESTLIYDSVWSLALALNSTISVQTSSNNSCEDVVSLEKFQYTSLKFGESVIESLVQEDFEGASGKVSFNPDGIRVHSSVEVLQYRNREMITIAVVEMDDNSDTYNFTYAASEDQATVYPDVLPLDGTPIKVVITFQPWLIALCYSLAAIGILFGLFCILFNIIFRRRRIVRLTSPNLNYLIVFGTILAYCTIFVHLIPTTSPEVYKIRCYVQTWMVTIGYTMAFGTVLAKLYRIWHIFKNPSPNKRALKDWHLLVIVVCVVSTGIVLLLLRIAIPQFRIAPSLSANSERPTGLNELGVMEQYCSWRCIGDNPVAYYWQIVYYIYILIVLVVALILAFQTRKVKIDVLNDSKWIAGITYVGVPLIVIFFIFTFVLSSYVQLSSAVYCIGLFLASTNFLALLFIPKMVAFCKDPKGESVFAKSSHFSAHDSTDRNRHGTMVTVSGPALKKVNIDNGSTEDKPLDTEISWYDK